MPGRMLALLPLTVALYAQAPPSAAPPLRFSVASVKANQGYIRKDMDPQMLRWHSTPLVVIVQDAWQLAGYQLIGMPADMETRWDIDGRTDSATTKEQKYEMLRTLLVERFGLKFHREMRDIPGYALVIAKGGPKLHEVTAADAGADEPDLSDEYGVRVGHHVRMSDWVGFLAHELGGPFEDDTGLKGVYDFKLEWSPKATPRPGNEAPDVDDGISLFTALQQQLGLKLEQKKIPVEVFVVDHVDKTPTAN